MDYLLYRDNYLKNNHYPFFVFLLFFISIVIIVCFLILLFPIYRETYNVYTRQNNEQGPSNSGEFDDSKRSNNPRRPNNPEDFFHGFDSD